MSAIYDALIRLNDKVIGLEKTAATSLGKVQVMREKLGEKKRGGKAPEPDLFAAGIPAGMPYANKNKNVGYDTSKLARKLDLAIEKVEQVLKEG